MTTINSTPASSNNNILSPSYIMEATDKMSELFANVEDFEEKNGADAVYGYSGLPGIMQEVRKLGIDKIFFVGRNYCGHYEDDDCYFTYWNEVEKKFEDDMWSTRFAAPSYDLYEMPIAFGAGWEAGMIDKEAYLKVLKQMHFDKASKIDFDKEKANDHYPKVRINRGRKWKGEGYLVDITESSYRFATPMYRNRYYGTRDFGVSTSRTAVIWDPITNTINRANADYIEYIDSEAIMGDYHEWAKNIIEHSYVFNIKSNGINGYGFYDLDIDYSFDRFMHEVWNPKHAIINSYPTDAYDAETEEKKRKESEFRTKKMAELIEWVKNNTDKKGDEITNLALHIFNKRYSKNG